MAITTFAYSGVTGDTPNNIRSLIQTGGFQRYRNFVQQGMAIVKFKSYNMTPIEDFDDDVDAITMQRLGIMMTGVIQQITGDFPNNIRTVRFADGQEPKIRFCYNIDRAEQGYIMSNLGGRIGINNHIIEEPYELPVNYTTDFLEVADMNNKLMTILNINIVKQFDISLNHISSTDLGESLVLTECYAKPLEYEESAELGELYQQMQDDKALEQADKEVREKTPVEAPESAVALTQEEIKLEQQSQKIAEFVKGKMSEQDAKRKAAELEQLEKKKKEAAINAQIENAKAEAMKKATEKIKENTEETEEKAPVSAKFNTDKLTKLFGQIESSTDKSKGNENTPDF